MMITNEVKIIKEEITDVPVIVRANTAGWVPMFELWSTVINDDTSCIMCPTVFNKKSKNYVKLPYDSAIGEYDSNNDLIIFWRCLINTEDIELINAVYSGKLKATCWPKRNVTYFSSGNSASPWLHSILFGCDMTDKVVHHINNNSVDNRRQNLHILPKREHDSIPKPTTDERKKMFEDLRTYKQYKKESLMRDFVSALNLIIKFEEKINFVSRFAEENPDLAKEILTKVKLDINLARLKYRLSENRKLNSHLDTVYLDAYEMETYLKKYANRTNKISVEESAQLRLF